MNMANTSNIKTRIILRNDELSNWNTSELVLNQGEIALARREDGSYEMRIGNGGKTWTQLGPQNYMLSASQVIGLESAMSQLSTSHYEVGGLDELSDSYTNGDTAVVKQLIVSSETDSRYSYTAYVYDASISAWKAMDGNYSAENVYLPNDMTMTYQFGKYAVPQSGSYVLSCKGMSVAEMINDAYAQTASGSVKDPSISLTTTASLNGEVGSTYTVPKATLTFKSGEYQYSNPKTATGVKVLAGNASISCTTEGTSATNSGDLANNGMLELPAGTANAKTFVDSPTTYDYSAKAVWTDGSIPKNNIGGDDSAKQIKTNSSNPATKTASCTATGWRRMYIGSVASDAEINEATLKALSYKEKASALTITVSSSGQPAPDTEATVGTTLVEEAVKIIVALPPGRNLKIVKLVSASNTPITDDYTNNTFSNIQVSGAAANANFADYTVYVYKPASIDSGEVHNITIE